LKIYRIVKKKYREPSSTALLNLCINQTKKAKQEATFATSGKLSVNYQKIKCILSDLFRKIFVNILDNHAAKA
jgi:hypothetical protein